MDGEDAAIRACLAHKVNLEARLKDAPTTERPRLLAEIAAGEALLQRFRAEDLVQGSAAPPLPLRSLGPATAAVPARPLRTRRASTE